MSLLALKNQKIFGVPKRLRIFKQIRTRSNPRVKNKDWKKK
jgi:hypothetical protein